MALPTLNYSEHLPPMKTSIPGVYAVNSSHILKGNLNVNETIQIAEEAIHTVLAPAINTPPTVAATALAEFSSSHNSTQHPMTRPARELVARS